VTVSWWSIKIIVFCTNVRILNVIVGLVKIISWRDCVMVVIWKLRICGGKNEQMDHRMETVI